MTNLLEEQDPFLTFIKAIMLSSWYIAGYEEVATDQKNY